jgi:hypothetical protein
MVMGIPSIEKLARYVELWTAYKREEIGLEDLKRSIALEFFPDDPVAQARVMELNEDLVRLMDEIVERRESPFLEEHAALVAELGPRITELFREERVSELLDPAVVILANRQPPAILMVERLILVELLAEARAVAATSLIAAQKPILVAVFGQDGSARFIEDPRLTPNWWARL